MQMQFLGTIETYVAQRSALVNLIRWPNAKQNTGIADLPSAAQLPKPLALMHGAQTKMSEIGLDDNDPLIEDIFWEDVKSSPFAGINGKPTHSLFNDAVREPLLSDLAKKGWYANERIYPIGHLLYAVNAFVSRHVPVFTDMGRSEKLPPAVIQADVMESQRALLLDIVGKCLLHGYGLGESKDDALNQMCAHVLYLDAIAADLATNNIFKKEQYPTHWYANESNRRKTFTKSRSKLLDLVNAWFADEPTRSLAQVIAALDTEIGLLAVVYARNLRGGVSAAASIAASIAATTTRLSRERAAAQATIEQATKFFSLLFAQGEYGRQTQLEGNALAAVIRRIVTVIFIAQIDLPWLMFGPLHEEPIGGLRGPAVSNPAPLMVGMHDPVHLRNWTVQLISYPPQAFRFINSLDQVMTGRDVLVARDELRVLNPDSVVDSLFYHLSKPTIMGVFNRLHSDYYSKTIALADNELKLPYVCGGRADRLLHAGQDTALQVPANASIVGIDRALRSYVAMYWHRFFSVHPDTLYLLSVLRQFARLDKTFGDTYSVAELRKVFPPQLYDDQMLALVVKHLLPSLQPPQSSSSSSEGLGGVVPRPSPAPLTDIYKIGTPKQAPQPAPAPAPAPPQQPPSPAPTMPIPVPSAAQLQFILGTPGAPLSRLVVSMPGDPLDARDKFMKAVLEPLYAEYPHLTAEGMAFALRWTLGIGLWKRETRRARVSSSMLFWNRMPSAGLAGGEAKQNIDYRTFKAHDNFLDAGSIATTEDVKDARDLQICPRIARNNGNHGTPRWYVEVQRPRSNPSHTFMFILDAQDIAPHVDNPAVTVVTVTKTMPAFIHAQAYDSVVDTSGAFSILLFCSMLLELSDTDLNLLLGTPPKMPVSAKMLVQPALVAGRVSSVATSNAENKLMIAQHVRNMVVSSALRLGELGASIKEQFTRTLPTAHDAISVASRK